MSINKYQCCSCQCVYMYAEEPTNIQYWTCTYKQKQTNKQTNKQQGYVHSPKQFRAAISLCTYLLVARKSSALAICR